MPVLCDTNLLLRSVQVGHPLRTEARNAIDTLLLRGEAVYLSRQSLVEFWVVATRPEERNGLGMTAAGAEVELARLENQFPVLPETEAIYAQWRILVTAHNVVGIRSYDIRLVAAMLAHGITEILTFNVGDFRRYPEITVLHPRDVV